MGPRTGRRRRRALVAALAAGATLGAVAAADAAFPGANGKIAYVVNVAGNFEIFTANPDGSGATNITNSATLDNAPDWSPDGTKIAFYRDSPNGVYIMNADGSGAAIVPNTTTADTTIGSVSWSPDGTRLAYVANIGAGLHQIQLIDADGTDADFIGPGSGAISGLEWSPDGTKLAFASSHDSGDPNLPEIYVIGVDDTGLTRLTTTSAAENTPDWRPDGGKVIWSVDASAVVSANPDGSSPVTLLAAGPTRYNVAYSPEGSKLVYGDGANVRTVNVDGTGDVAGAAGNTRQHDWQPTAAQPPGDTTFSVGDVRQAEGDSPGKTVGTRDMIFTIRRSGPLGVTSTVRYATGNGTAGAPGDFLAKSGQIRFEPGKKTRTIRVKIKADNVGEANEVFPFRLTKATGATIADDTGIGTILNDD